MKKTFVFAATMLLVERAGVRAAAAAGAGGAAGGGQRRPAARARSARRWAAASAAPIPYNCKDTPNPLPKNPSVFIEEMTWMDVRDALAEGKTTAIITTGGIEPNGPWLVTGKHNYVNRANCEAIARKLGNALCAPNIEFVPEGDIDPPTSHMTQPGHDQPARRHLPRACSPTSRTA